MREKYDLSTERANYFVVEARQLIKLLRVKIDDDNDLKLARKALSETRLMLQNLSRLADSRNTDEFDLVTKWLK